MKHGTLWFVVGMLSIAALACGPTPSTVEPATEPPGPTPIGRAIREADTVELGRSGGALQPVADTADLFAGDALRITGGGSSLLDFGALSFRLFNDSDLDVVSAEPGPEGSLEEIAFFLEQGGVIGDLTPEGGQVVWNTPGGATITVSGTEFMITYDPAASMLMVGNFGGDIAWQTAQGVEQVPDGYYMVQTGSTGPGDPIPLPWDRAHFEEQAVEQGSLQNAAGDAQTSDWVIWVSWDQNWYTPGLEPRAAPVLFQELAEIAYTQHATFGGSFTVSGAGIEGAGSGGALSEQLFCNGEITSASSFFDLGIGGELSIRNGAPAFLLSLDLSSVDISAPGVTISRTQQCILDQAGRENVVRALQDAVAQVALPAQHGAWVTQPVMHPLLQREVPLNILLLAQDETDVPAGDDAAPLIMSIHHTDPITGYGDQGCTPPLSFEARVFVGDGGPQAAADLFFRYTDGPSLKYQSEWQVAHMEAVSPDSFALAISSTDYPVGEWINGQRIGAVEYYVLVRDAAGHEAQSDVQVILLERCTIIELGGLALRVE